jgi:hypothetical protein
MKPFDLSTSGVARTVAFRTVLPDGQPPRHATRRGPGAYSRNALHERLRAPPACRVGHQRPSGSGVSRHSPCEPSPPRRASARCPHPETIAEVTTETRRAAATCQRSRAAPAAAPRRMQAMDATRRRHRRPLPPAKRESENRPTMVDVTTTVVTSEIPVDAPQSPADPWPARAPS